MSIIPEGVRTTPPPPLSATTLVLIRHGEARCNVDGIVGGRAGCTGLTDQGVAQARALRQRLTVSGELEQAVALYSSVLPRAGQTAQIIAAAVGEGNLEVVADCDLCELHPGQADGLTWPEFGARFPEPDWDRHPDMEVAPGGESWSGFVHRAAGALKVLSERHAGQTVVVVCHAGVIEAAMLELLSLSALRPRLKLRTVHCSITEFELVDDGWRLLRYNDAAHLAQLRAAP